MDKAIIGYTQRGCELMIVEFDIMKEMLISGVAR